MRPLRSEWKFLLHHDVKRVLLERWRPYLVRAPFTNPHAVSPILSQYYDSPHLDFFHDKIEGVGIRDKVRLRTYGHRYEEGATTFLEIKQRQNDLVRKFRYRMPDFHPEQLDPRNWRFDDAEMEAAFQSLSLRYRLRASAQTWYQREAYEGAVESDLRVTFDSVLRGLHPGEVLTRELLFDDARRLMPDTLVILEVKATRGVPRWIHEGVLAAELRQQTIPKYVTAVEVLGLPALSPAGAYG